MSKNEGSNFYNYKGFHSIVLMAICDSNYCFSYVHIGAYGKDNHASIFGDTAVFQAFENNVLNLPGEEEILTHSLPYVLVSDEIFPLKPWLMKPYPARNLTEEKRVYNYRLSRARRTIENTFGILSAKWRIFRKPIRASVDTVEAITKARVCLHNYLKQTDNAGYTPDGFVDSECCNTGSMEGSWGSVVGNQQCAVTSIGSNNFTQEAKDIREKLLAYFNSTERSIPWQLGHVMHTGAMLNLT